jgi:hypothetical protein
MYRFKEDFMDESDSENENNDILQVMFLRADTDAKPFREALTCEVNSALLTFENHSADNIFVDPSCAAMERMLRECHYEPVGVSRHIPFNRHRSSQIGFVYRYNDELYWCHMPSVCWMGFLQEIRAV